MKKLILLCVLFAGCSAPANIGLPLKVVAKNVSDEGSCQLTLKPVRQEPKDYLSFYTSYQGEYCFYEIGQEVK